jgi:hypothetical protein
MSRIIKHHWHHIRLLFTFVLLVSGCLMLSSAFGRQRHPARSGKINTPVPLGVSARTPTYAAGTVTFSTPIEMVKPRSLIFFQHNAEPEIHIDLFGTIYITAINGVPGGTDLWKSNNAGTTFPYLGEPDGAQDKCAAPTPQCLGAGGGDDSTDVSPGGYLYVSSLYIGNVTVSTSMDGGTSGTTPDQAWVVNPAAAAVVSDDRQWIAAYGPRTLNMTYRQAPGTGDLFFVKSTDAGKTFGTPVLVRSGNSTEGNLVVDPYNGNLYTTTIPSTATNQIHLLKSTDGGATWTETTAYTAAAGADPGHKFTVLALDRGGNLHLVFSESNAAKTSYHVYLTSTSNPSAATPGWLPPVQVDSGTGDTTFAVMPWVVAGSPGIVDITWLGSPNSPDVFPGAWYVYYAQTTNALSSTPLITEQKALSKSVHDQDICFNGTGCTPNNPRQGGGNRDLLEYYTIALDPNGQAHIAYPDSLTADCLPADCQTNTWYIRQQNGANAYAPPPAPTDATFGANVNVAANGGGGAEPNSEVDSHNCIFSAAPGNPDFWKSINNGAAFLAPVNPVADENGLTGGDEDILSIPQTTGQRPDFLYFVDLGITSVHVRKSTDGGASWAAPGPGGAAGEVSASSDRMWLDFDRDVPAAGNQTIYLMDHEFTSETIRFSALTNDTAWSSFTTAMNDPELFNPTTTTFPNTNPGPAFVDRATHLVYGVFNASTLANNAANPPFGKMPNVWLVAGAPPPAAGSPPGPFVSSPTCPNCGNYPIFKGVFDSPAAPAPTPPAGAETIGTNCSNDFPSATIDNAGNIYAVWAMNDSRLNHFNVWMASSHDHGKNFYGPFLVSSGPGHSLMPWIAAGDAGRVEIVYYHTDGNEDPNTTASDEWHVRFAQSLNAADREPVFSVVEASDHPNHIGPICNQGLLCGSGTRNLLDFFQVAIGPDGLANIVYADDNNQGNNVHPEFARQTGGPLGLINPPGVGVTCLASNSLVPVNVVSRKVHGDNTGTHDVDLPLTGPPGIECRKGGGSDGKDHTIVISFAQPITSVGGASVDSSDSMAMADTPSVNQQIVTVNLHKVTNAQIITLHLTNVSDGTNTAPDIGIPMGVLLGDVDASAHVDVGDISPVQATNSQRTSDRNFRGDVDVSGHIDAGDIGYIQNGNSTGFGPPVMAPNRRRVNVSARR